MYPAKIYMVCGVPGSGKSWVCSKLTHKFRYIAHDDFIPYGKDARKEYEKALLAEAKIPGKPVLGDAPFMVSIIINNLRAKGARVKPYFVIESAPITKMRYEEREGKPIPKQHLTRIATMKERAAQYMAPSGSSKEILEMLREV